VCSGGHGSLPGLLYSLGRIIKIHKEVQIMFVVIINFPAIKEGKDTEFREWFPESA
jgi:hypothetical protein